MHRSVHWQHVLTFQVRIHTKSEFTPKSLNISPWIKIGSCHTVRGFKHSRLLNFSQSFYFLIQFCWDSFWMQEPVISKKTGKPVYGYAGLALKNHFWPQVTWLTPVLSQVHDQWSNWTVSFAGMQNDQYRQKFEAIKAFVSQEWAEINKTRTEKVTQKKFIAISKVSPFPINIFWNFS